MGDDQRPTEGDSRLRATRRTDFNSAYNKNESVPIQLAQCRFRGLAISSAKILIYFFPMKNAEAILSNSTRKLLWFEFSKFS